MTLDQRIAGLRRLSDNALIDAGRQTAAGMKGHRISVTNDFLIRFGRNIEQRCARTAGPTDMLDVIDALVQRVAEVEAERCWRPIETAPRDGAVIFLCDENGNRWTDVSPGEMYRSNGCGMPPTHWQPLPAPPISAELRALTGKEGS